MPSQCVWGISGKSAQKGDNLNKFPNTPEREHFRKKKSLGDRAGGGRRRPVLEQEIVLSSFSTDLLRGPQEVTQEEYAELLS